MGVRKTKNRTNTFCLNPSPIKSFRQNFLCGKFINPMFPFKTVGVPYMSYKSCIIGCSRILSKFSTTGIIFQEQICHKKKKSWNNYPWKPNQVIYAVKIIWTLASWCVYGYRGGTTLFFPPIFKNNGHTIISMNSLLIYLY